MADENITVLVLNNVKRVKSFKVNRFRIRMAVISAISLISVLILSLGANYYLLRENLNISNELAMQPGRTPNPAITAVDENENGSSDNQLNDIQEPVTDDSVSNPAESVPPSAAVEMDIFESDLSSEVVSVENVESTRELNRIELNVSFNLVNILETNDVVSGYVTIAARTTDNRFPYVSWPHMELHTDGTPVDYLKGDRFSIKYLKTVEARMLLNNPSERYQYFRINVFALDGRLLMRKTFEVEE